jgi:hypothetical protein
MVLRTLIGGLALLPADDPGTPYSRRSDKSSSEPGDVELIERTIGDGAATGESKRETHMQGSAKQCM